MAVIALCTGAAAMAAAQNAPRPAEREGLYVRFRSGLGYFAARAVTRKATLTLNGSGGGGAFAAGFAASGHLILHAELFAHGGGGGDLAGGGLGVTYYPTGSGPHVAATLASSLLVITEERRGEQWFDEGVAALLLVGTEWRVHTSWSYGVGVQVGFGSVPAGLPGVTWATRSMLLVAGWTRD